MTDADLLDLLDRCGGNRAAWPAGADAAVDRLLARSPKARAALDAQQTVDAALKATVETRAPAGLAERAMRGRQAQPPTSARPARWAAAAALALALGAAVGVAHGGFEDPGATVASALAIPGEPADAG